MSVTRRQQRLLLLIVVAYVLVAVSYALSTPPLEASDEFKHYPVVQYVQTTDSLPVLNPEAPGRWLQEGAQPPLYYLLMAGLTRWIDTGDLAAVHQTNPHAFVGNPNQVLNKNLIVHRRENEAFPWHGTVLAVYVIRLATIALGIVTILIIAQLGTLLVGSRVGLLATALTAFNPMFLFVHASVNNDAMAILMGTLGLYLLVLLWRDKPDPGAKWLRYFVIGVVLGLAVLTKLSLGGLLLLAAMTMAGLAWRTHNWRYVLVGGTIVFGIALLVVVPWLARNLRIYGDPLAMGVFIDVQGARESLPSLRNWADEFGTLYRSFWGLFGGVNVAAPEGFYVLYNVVAIAGSVGFILWLCRNGRPVLGSNAAVASGETLPAYQPVHWKSLLFDSGLWLLLIWSATVLLLLIRWNLIYFSFQGRLLFPAIGAVNIILSAGLLAWVRPALQSKLVMGLSVLAFLAAALLPWITIRPAYVFPEPLAQVPDKDLFGPIIFRSGDDEIRLIGVEVAPDQSVAPGQGFVEVALYWQAAGRLDRNFLSTIHLLGRDNQSVGSVNRYPAWGMVPTSDWQPGQIWRDVYHVYVDAGTAAPARLSIKVGMYDPQLERDLDAYGPDGSRIELLLVGEARLTAPEGSAPVPGNPAKVPFADNVTLVGYELDPQSLQPGEPVLLRLFWEAVERPSQDYTVFVHLVDETGDQVAGADGPPVAGDYPTHLWRPGDTIVDEHALAVPADLPPGDYKIIVGMYDPASLVRLPRLDGNGDAFELPVHLRGES